MRRFVAYQQLEHSDCGIACVRMIARHFGRRIPSRIISELADMNRLGVTIKDIIKCADSIGLESRPLKLTPDMLSGMPLPAILYWDQKHFVVLYKMTDNGSKFWIADPANGKITLKRNEFLTHWLSGNSFGIAILAGPREEFYTKEYPSVKHGKNIFALLRNSIATHKKTFSAIIVFTLISLIGDLLLPLTFQRTIDEGINGRDIHLVWLLILAQLGIFVGRYITSNISDLIMTKLGLRVSIDMMNAYLAKIVRLPMEFFDRKVNSDLIQKTQDQERLKNFMVGMPDTAFFTSFNLIVFSGLLIWFNFAIFCIFIIFTSANIGWTALFLRKRKEIDYAYFHYVGENRNNLYELIYGMPEIKTNNAQQLRVDVWKHIQDKINRLSMKSALIRLYLNGGTSFISQIRDITITGLCATLVIQDAMSIGVMMTVTYITGRLATPFYNIFNSISTIQDASISYERLDEILNFKTKETDGKKPEAASDIRINDISFKYPGSASPTVIRNLSLNIPSGKTTAIVGASGCGKTTLLKLLLGFYTPQSGTISIGDLTLNDIDTDAWLDKCGMVMQDGYIFSGSIKENIALGDLHPDQQRIEEAIRLACLEEYIGNLPMGLNTRIGANGLTMSGGQKQRLLIARAIYKSPELLILDEATSSLDANTERAIVENLRGFSDKRTVVVAAHRLSTVRRADNIVVMDNGQIIEQGSHEQLLANTGPYYRLVHNQLELG